MSALQASALDFEVKQLVVMLEVCSVVLVIVALTALPGLPVRRNKLRNNGQGNNAVSLETWIY